MLPRPTVAVRVGETMGPLEWADVSEEGFTFSSYLQSFLQALGHRARVFNSLEGRYIVPFQAVMQREVWELVRETVEDAMQKQMTAYRRARGGKTGPKIKADVEPKFMELKPFCSETASGPGRDRPPDDSMPLVVRHTFLHFVEESLGDSDNSPRSDMG
eukprot:gb/GFBE01038773.1/.p1 GENE.gb/GFBE01038773.1/~~gb/GFBE01038773.1/.p1  ORF type:complete len:159 (+),score=28.26 gb/GFBE01038773.1/:1-477(+)